MSIECFKLGLGLWFWQWWRYMFGEYVQWQTNVGWDESSYSSPHSTLHTPNLLSYLYFPTLPTHSLC